MCVPRSRSSKTADPTVISPGDEVTYKLMITNLSTVEDVTLLTLVDDRFGDLLAECEELRHGDDARAGCLDDVRVRAVCSTRRPTPRTRTS